MTATMRWLTPIGDAAIAVMRIEGGQVDLLLARHLPRGLPAPPGSLALRMFVDGDDAVIDEVLIRRVDCLHGRVIFELCSHGGIETARRLVAALRASGVSLALEPAEHASLLEEEIYRAFLAARSVTAVRFFRNELHHGMPVKLRSWLQGQQSLVSLADRIPAWRERYRSAHAWVEPPSVVLIGSVNAGKSSLLNALVQDERAMVSPVAGTTRDPLRAEILIEDYPVAVWDTAGFGAQHASGAATGIDQAAVELTRMLVARADLLIELVDPSARERGALDVECHVPRIVLGSKSDTARTSLTAVDLVCSARTGEGLTELKRAIVARLRLLPREQVLCGAPFLPRHLAAIDALAAAAGDEQRRDALCQWLGDAARCACGS